MKNKLSTFFLTLMSNHKLATLILITALLVYLKIFIRTFSKKRLLTRVLKDNDLYKEEQTKILMMSDKKITILNYKHKPNEVIDKVVNIFEIETGERYFYERKNSKITILKFPEIPKIEGLYKQNVINGHMEKFTIPNHINGILIAGKTGSGKSVLINKLLTKMQYQDLLIVSPKGNEDFENGVMPTKEVEERLLEIISNSNEGFYKEKRAIIILDELITLSKTFSKDTIEKINTSLTICRSQGLNFILATQKLNKASAGIDISLTSIKVLAVDDIANFIESLGINKPKTSVSTLSAGEFLMFLNGEEYLLKNQL